MIPRSASTTWQKARASEPVAFWLSTWFGCGLVPIAPGTAGSAGALPLCLLILPFGKVTLAACAALITLVGIWAASRVSHATGQKDPQFVVIDEVAGMTITCLGAPTTVPGLVAAFLLFRLFDQLKPFPAGLCERRLPSGFGIMLDDVFAGLWAVAVLLVVRRIGWL